MDASNAVMKLLVIYPVPHNAISVVYIQIIVQHVQALRKISMVHQHVQVVFLVTTV